MLIYIYLMGKWVPFCDQNQPSTQDIQDKKGTVQVLNTFNTENWVSTENNCAY